MSYRFQSEQWLARPLEEVFRFFANPRNLPRIMPAWMEVRIEDSTVVSPPDSADFAGVGSRLLASYRAIPFLPFRIHSEAQIIGFAMNAFFVDIQGSGPFKSWHHRHEFTAESRNGAAGTRLRDQIEYEVGFEPLGSIVNRLLIAPQMRRVFLHRQQVVERFLDRME